jgi:hypothetical protein
MQMMRVCCGYVLGDMGMRVLQYAGDRQPDWPSPELVLHRLFGNTLCPVVGYYSTSKKRLEMASKRIAITAAVGNPSN